MLNEFLYGMIVFLLIIFSVPKEKNSTDTEEKDWGVGVKVNPVQFPWL
jgi:hypothetical protein